MLLYQQKQAADINVYLYYANSDTNRVIYNNFAVDYMSLLDFTITNLCFKV